MLAEALDTPVVELHDNQAKPPAEVTATALAPVSSMRARIEALERELTQFERAGIKVVHRFAPGLYMREITVPADCLMTGRVHHFEHMSVMVSGEMTTLVGDEMRLISGYNPFVAPAGTKRVGYTHTEVVWLTVHLNPDELRDPEQLEAMLCDPVQAALLEVSP